MILFEFTENISLKELNLPPSFYSQKQSLLAKKLFLQNCSICHIQHKNFILPEKNLILENLKKDGLLNINNFQSQILNGTNHSSFLQKLNKNQLKLISSLILPF